MVMWWFGCGCRKKVGYRYDIVSCIHSLRPNNHHIGWLTRSKKWKVNPFTDFPFTITNKESCVTPDNGRNGMMRFLFFKVIPTTTLQSIFVEGLKPLTKEYLLVKYQDI